MQSKADTPGQYLDELPRERQEPMRKLRAAIRDHLPPGFEETMAYGMIGWVVPHEVYPPGYHANPKLPLPFINLASQKQYIAVYHMGLYAQPELLDWFRSEWGRVVSTKLDMGKSCIRFRKPEHIPYDLIAELAGKMTPAEWVALYEAAR